MNPLVKKEIRLLLPGWIFALLAAMVQGITRPYDFYVASLLFFGLAIMALTTMGRESSLNTFSTLLAQPAERLRLWKTKLSVLAAAFLTVFAVWLAAFGIACFQSEVGDADRANSYNLFITICLIVAATFTGGLWTTLLLRQIAGAFWLTLLAPAILTGTFAAFLANSDNDPLLVAVLSVVIGIYAIAGFFYARWLFFRAQDIGWSGGVIALPEWKWRTARTGTRDAVRMKRPLVALVKKELQLHQVTLLGAAALLILHVGIVLLRINYVFPKDSAGSTLTSIFWMLWVVMAPVVGGMAVAEERRLGVMDGQLCSPASRRLQFFIKATMTFFLGIFLGGVMPMLVESIGASLGSHNLIFSHETTPPGQPEIYSPHAPYLLFLVGVVAFAAWLVLVSFYASTLAKNFIHAMGFGVAVFFGCVLIVPLFTNGRMLFLDNMSGQCLLPLVIAVPAIPITLLWLAYRNFNHFSEGSPLWRRNVGGIIGALLFVFTSSNFLYYRAWEMLEPAEPAHGPAKLSLSNPAILRNETYENLLVRLPDGRVWFDFLTWGIPRGESFQPWQIFKLAINPPPYSGGPRRFIGGTNWVNASARHAYEQVQYEPGQSAEDQIIEGYADSVGIQPDGTLWASGKSVPRVWTADQLTRFGNGTNWIQLARGYSLTSVLLLKSDGTLWRWGTNYSNLSGWPYTWPGIRNYEPYQIGTDSDWKELYSLGGLYARKADGSIWLVLGHPKKGEDELVRMAKYDDIFSQSSSICRLGGNFDACVHRDGTLWLSGEDNSLATPKFETQQTSGTNWTAVAKAWDYLVALKTDGTLWQWKMDYRRTLAESFATTPTRLGIHNDSIAIAGVENGIVSLAADGSLWFWPNPSHLSEFEVLMRWPKQPAYVGNVFSQGN